MQLKVILIHAAPEFAYPTQEFWDTHSAVKSSQVTRAMPKIGLVWFVFLVWFGCERAWQHFPSAAVDA